MIYSPIRCWSFYNGFKSRPVTKLLQHIGTSIFFQKLHTKRSYKVLFFGSDDFSVHSLKALHDCNQCRSDNTKPIEDLAVVTSFKGADNAVRKFTKSTNIPLFGWPLQDPVELCSGFDVGVVVSFGHLIPEPIINAFPFGMINVHASLLPKWRGAAPIIHALRNGDTATGITIMKIRPRQFDIGEILAQRIVPIDPHMLMPELHEKLARIGADELLITMRTLEQSLRDAQPQPKISNHYAPKVTKELLNVHWNEMTAQQVYDLYRALFSYKRLMTSWHGEPVRIVEMTLLPTTANPQMEVKRHAPGTVEYCRHARHLRVWCADGRCVGIRRLRMMAKPEFTAATFSNGYLQKGHINDTKPSMFV